MISMMRASESAVSFEETGARHDEMHSTIEDAIDELVGTLSTQNTTFGVKAVDTVSGLSCTGRTVDSCSQLRRSRISETEQVEVMTVVVFDGVSVHDVGSSNVLNRQSCRIKNRDAVAGRSP